MQQLIINTTIRIYFSSHYSSGETISRDGIIQWTNNIAVCFMSDGEQFVVPWTSIRYLKVL